MDLEREIMRRVRAMPIERQRELLAYFDMFGQTSFHGERGTALLPFAGVLDSTSAAEMNKAVDSACETVDTREW